MLIQNTESHLKSTQNQSKLVEKLSLTKLTYLILQTKLNTTTNKIFANNSNIKRGQLRLSPLFVYTGGKEIMKYAVGIDVGGTNTRVALINEQYEIKERVQFGSDPKDPMKTLNQINDVIKEFGQEIEGIGISCPGPLDLINGVILTPPNLPGWHNFELTKELEKITGVSVQLENDANLAGLAEAVIGAGKGKKIIEFLTISTGVGAGLCIDGKIYRGAKGFAQEVANCILWKNGPSQGDLKKGSIESIASGTAITKRANDAGLNAAHAGEVYQLAQEGNETAAAIMEDAYEYLSSFIATLYGILDPELFVLSGSVALKIPGFIEEIEKRAKGKVYDALKGNVKIVPAALGEDCGLIGAACLAFSK